MRDIVVFPINQGCEDLLWGAPAPATPKQLRELHIRSTATPAGEAKKPDADPDKLVSPHGA